MMTRRYRDDIIKKYITYKALEKQESLRGDPTKYTNMLAKMNVSNAEIIEYNLRKNYYNNPNDYTWAAYEKTRKFMKLSPIQRIHKTKAENKKIYEDYKKQYMTQVKGYDDGRREIRAEMNQRRNPIDKPSTNGHNDGRKEIREEMNQRRKIDNEKRWKKYRTIRAKNKIKNKKKNINVGKSKKKEFIPNIGDVVQVYPNGLDVVSGIRARGGSGFGKGGPIFLKVYSIKKNWSTSKKFGLPAKITKVTCTDTSGRTVFWQGQPKDLVVIVSVKDKNKKKDNKNDKNKKKDKKKKKKYKYKFGDVYGSAFPYALVKGSEVWSAAGGVGTATQIPSLYLPHIRGQKTKKIEKSEFGTTKFEKPIHSYEEVKTIEKDEKGKVIPPIRGLTTKQRKEIGSPMVSLANIHVGRFDTAWKNKKKREEMLNDRKSLIQNEYDFPKKIKGANYTERLAAQYDYQIIIGDDRYDGPTASLRSKLRDMRADLGLPVHGNERLARSMKYYMYNRWKTPDINLLYTKGTTHVFFTRPDLNLLKKSGNSYKAVGQVYNHTEAAMLYRRYPELFKLLTDHSRCGDDNNFNMLLSNQVQSFDIQDETLSSVRVGKSWNEYEMTYGDTYSGRTAGEFSCDFADTSDFEIINLMKLWITYIDNVSRGAWDPSYNLYGAGKNKFGSSHIHTKTLDYASSVYVFKCGPDGEEVLYWSKYYGIFPLNTGASSLSWNLSNPTGDGGKLNIKFGYSYKRDLSPISLLEFNDASEVSSHNAIYDPGFSFELGKSSRPYVGAPFIEIDLGDPRFNHDDVSSGKKTTIRLKFRSDSGIRRTDNMLFSSND